MDFQLGRYGKNLGRYEYWLGRYEFGAKKSWGEIAFLKWGDIEMGRNVLHAFHIASIRYGKVLK